MDGAMDGIVIRYSYDGDEAEWQRVIDGFLAAIAADADVQGRFRYVVTVRNDGVSRTHIGRWDSEETLTTLQGRDYFATFSEAIQGFAGDTLEAIRCRVYGETG